MNEKTVQSVVRLLLDVVASGSDDQQPVRD